MKNPFSRMAAGIIYALGQVLCFVGIHGKQYWFQGDNVRLWNRRKDGEQFRFCSRCKRQFLSQSIADWDWKIEGLHNPFSRPRDVIALGLTLVVCIAIVGCGHPQPIKGGSVSSEHETTVHTDKETSKTPVFAPVPSQDSHNLTVVIGGNPIEPSTQPATRPAHDDYWKTHDGVRDLFNEIVEFYRQYNAAQIANQPVPQFATSEKVETTATTQSAVAATQSDNPKGDLTVKPSGDVTVSGAFSIDAEVAAAVATVKQYAIVIAIGAALVLLAVVVLILKFGGSFIPVIGPIVGPMFANFPIAVPIILGVSGLALIAFPSYIERYPLATAITFAVVGVGLAFWHALGNGIHQKALSDLAASPEVPNDATHPNPIVQAALDKAPLNPPVVTAPVAGVGK